MPVKKEELGILAKDEKRSIDELCKAK